MKLRIVQLRSGRVAGALVALATLGVALPASAGAEASAGALDSRGWELVSPVEKNGGEVAAPGGEGAGVLQAAAGGGAVAFASEASFGEAAGAAPISQYLASRGGGGWVTENVTPALLSGTYDGDPYLLFSDDLLRAVLSGGWACRDGGEECEAEGPPLGAGGPSGYRNAFRLEGSTYTPLITAGNSPELTGSISAEDFRLSVPGASPGLGHVIVSTCAKLTSQATEVPDGSGGCEASAQNLYEWSAGTLKAVNLLPGETETTPGATLPAVRGAVSEDGSRVYFNDGGKLYLREGIQTTEVAEGGQLQAASDDGSLAFYLKASKIYRYDAVAESTQEVTPSGGAAAAVGASSDGAYLFYVAAAGGLYRWHAGTATKIANATAAQLPPQTGRAGVAAGGARFLFTSPAALLPLSDSNGRADAYEWEAQGTGSCATAPGCLGLLSSGRSGEAKFVAASASGDDAYFLTGTSLLPLDPSAVDLYDARAGGGFPEPQPGIECVGDDCQGPPFVPQDPAPASSVVSGPPNPPLPSTKGCPKGKRLVKKHGKTRCVAKHHKRRHKRRHHKRGAR